jgi:PadR family transcriptional regulator, regulatory protein AphA
METSVFEIKGKKLVELAKGKGVIRNESDALDIAGTCGFNSAPRALIDAESLAREFFDLKTGLAGAVLQKFINYRIRVAAVIPEERIGNGRFYEMVKEANRGGDFRVFQDREKAIDWLVSGDSL